MLEFHYSKGNTRLGFIRFFSKESSNMKYLTKSRVHKDLYSGRKNLVFSGETMAFVWWQNKSLRPQISHQSSKVSNYIKRKKVQTDSRWYLWIQRQHFYSGTQSWDVSDMRKTHTLEKKQHLSNSFQNCFTPNQSLGCDTDANPGKIKTDLTSYE